MTWVALILLFALHGAAEDVSWPPGEVVTETCNTDTGECAPPPSELPGPRPAG